VEAQVFEDHFNYPNGSLLPGWTQEKGSWTVRNGRLVGTGQGWRFLSKKGIRAKDCVMEGTFFFAGQGLQFGGLAGRQPGKGSATNLVLGKIQNNWGGKGFDQAYLYELPSKHIFTNLTKRGVPSVSLRLLLLDDKAWLRMDTDRDGFFESSLGPILLTHVKGPGLVGFGSYGPTEMDDFKFYDAVLMEVPGSVPRIGGAYKMRLRAPSTGTGPTAYACFASFGNAGIPLKARKIPLSSDPLFTLCFFLPQVFPRFFGYLDAKGDAYPEIRIPKDPALSGLILHVAGITLDPRKPFGVGAISNDHQFRIR